MAEIKSLANSFIGNASCESSHASSLFRSGNPDSSLNTKGYLGSSGSGQLRCSSFHNVHFHGHRWFMDSREDTFIDCQIHCSGEVISETSSLFIFQVGYNTKSYVFGIFLLFKNPNYRKVWPLWFIQLIIVVHCQFLINKSKRLIGKGSEETKVRSTGEPSKSYMKWLGMCKFVFSIKKLCTIFMKILPCKYKYQGSYRFLWKWYSWELKLVVRKEKLDFWKNLLLLVNVLCTWSIVWVQSEPTMTVRILRIPFFV